VESVDVLLEWWSCVLKTWPVRMQPQVCSIYVLVLGSIGIDRNNRMFKNKSNIEALLLHAIVEKTDKWKILTE
jgi:hypothetical protein